MKSLIADTASDRETMEQQGQDAQWLSDQFLILTYKYLVKNLHVISMDSLSVMGNSYTLPIQNPTLPKIHFNSLECGGGGYPIFSKDANIPKTETLTLTITRFGERFWNNARPSPWGTVNCEQL